MTLTETKQLISESGAKVAWLKGYVVVVGLLLVSLCVYYFRYIPSRKAEINSRNFRLLADLSDHIKSEILLLPSVLSNSVKSLSSKESQDLNQTLGLINKSLRNLTLQAGPKQQQSPNGFGTRTTLTVIPPYWSLIILGPTIRSKPVSH